VGGAHVVQPKLVTHRRTEHVIEHQAECSYIGHTGILNDHAVQGRRKLDVSPATRNRVTFAAVRSPRSRPTPIESGSTTKALSVHNVSGHESASSRQVTGPTKKPNAVQRSRRRSISTTAASRSTSRSTQVKIPLDPASSATTASHRVKTEARRVRPPATCQQHAPVNRGQKRYTASSHFSRSEPLSSRSALVPKLNTRVRFPSSALTRKPQVTGFLLWIWGFRFC
jgi:hypothetical protein